ncbi:microtubule-actin cross-linking factor 1, isoforms 6/7 isoform X3 [Amyelois transitella]|nr:microtubule-actin cross-linking factor 1, isoforms 6/7 isoform X2 [Amyelois transitella]XP_060800399.1 microtubule-actin cross-linking factor 1, isoforms 6/7 isoform X3 [Amyelois transitella]
MRLMQLVRPHKPSRQDERERIEASGGTVMYWGTWRVNGQLAVSRAIGDVHYKPYVTARPEIATVDLDGDEDFVVVACDGLWDFVSEDDVALAVYRQLAADPDDLKAVTKRLVVQAKRQGSSDNISIIVVFLKDPRDIAADNSPPMELGLDNALANTFAMEAEACKRQLIVDGGECADADNGVDNSDSDSEDLGPETAVDVDLDADADDVDAEGNHEPAAPTPPADTVEEGHVDGLLVDNVAESGEESEDEWNYIKGEGEREENPSEEPDEAPRSPTSCQDNSAWESSSVDMNSSPLNPDAPVFIPGTVAGADLLLAESPRKPKTMDDIELPDVNQFETEAAVRPAELLDLDNCDQLNGHHNVSLDDAGNEKMNGNDKCNMDSLGFGFGVGADTDKMLDKGLIEDFERIQKDTTDFCNIQVFQTHTETNPFANETTDELFERLKNKERDPMSMSFYQEKDDDTCERLGREPPVDLNAVQPLPDSDDEDTQPNGICDNGDDFGKENVAPEEKTDLIDTDVPEPNNDIMRFDCRPDVNSEPTDPFGQGDNFVDYNVTNNIPGFEFESSNVSQNTILQTDTPESHKLLFEQIPEIPDGKSSELGFTNEDLPSESEKDARAFTPQEETSQDVDMESKSEDSPCAETQPELPAEPHEPQAVSLEVAQQENKDNEILLESALTPDIQQPTEQFSTMDDEKSNGTFSPEVPHDTQENIVVDVHQNNESNDVEEIPEIRFETDQSYAEKPTEENFIPDEVSPIPSQSPLPSDVAQSPVPAEVPHPAESPLPRESPLARSPFDDRVEAESPLPSRSPVPSESKSPIPEAIDSLAVAKSPTPVPSPEVPVAVSPAPVLEEAILEPEQSNETFAQIESHSPAPAEVPLPRESPAPASRDLQSPAPAESAERPETAEPADAQTLTDKLDDELLARLTPEVAAEETRVAAESASEVTGPAPDIVPDSPRSDLVTDIDIGIPESRAQEICVPVTSEIQLADAEQPAAATPPPTPAVLPAGAAPLAGAALAVAGAAAAAAVAKTKTPAKKSPTTPTAAKVDARTPKAAAKAAPSPRAPLSASKKPAAAARTPTASKPATPASKPTTPAARPAAATARPAPAARPAAAKPAAAARPAGSKPATGPSAPKPAAPRAAPPARTAAPRPATAPARPAAAAPKPAAPAAPKAAAPRPAAPRPTPRPAAARPATAPAPASAKPKVTEKKPVTNGDVKDAKLPAKAPLRAAARPAPRPAPRAPAAAPASNTDKAAPKPGARALDKPGKDLANRRLSARAAPPRTAAAKAPVKGTTMKPVPKKSVESTKIESAAQSAALNGDAPPPDGALLPDVIA